MLLKSTFNPQSNINKGFVPVSMGYDWFTVRW